MSSALPRINKFAQISRFFRVTRLLLWTLWVIYRERQRVVRAHERGHYEVRPNVEVLVKVLVAYRTTAIQLGGLMIKLGQFLSSRADLLPEQALKVLSSLQDEVPPAPFEHVVHVVESELGKPVEEVFSTLESKCTAAASLGQVHKGVLAATGETVAVKIQRPNIDQLVAMDLGSLRFVIRVIQFFIKTGNFIDLMAFYREFRRTTFEEIDYVTEAANGKRFREMFQDDPTIYIPQIYDAYVSRRVLVLEWIEGIKVNDYAALEAANINRLEVATRTVNAYFHQFFEAGFFHADPHPGNIFVKRGSPEDGPVIAFVDFGMVGTLTKSMKVSLRDIFLGFVTRNAHSIVDGLVKLGFIGRSANLASIERGISLMLEQYYGITLGEVRELDFPEVAQELENLLYGQPFQVPAQFAFTGRAVGTLVGVTTGLSPNFNFIDVAIPYARGFLGLDSDGISDTLQEVLSQLLDTGRVVLTLPNKIDRLLTRIETGQLEVKIGGISTGRRGRRRNANGANGLNGGESSAGTVARAFIFASALAAGVYLLNTAHNFVPGWFCLGVAGLTAIVLWVRS
jgi:predicted unusual protein kinase regulating ubiquinone biosynthesis (AarF/ABC1/UbiB family)